MISQPLPGESLLPLLWILGQQNVISETRMEDCFLAYLMMNYNSEFYV